MCLKCENAIWLFQPEEGLSRGPGLGPSQQLRILRKTSFPALLITQSLRGSMLIVPIWVSSELIINSLSNLIICFLVWTVWTENHLWLASLLLEPTLDILRLNKVKVLRVENHHLQPLFWTLDILFESWEPRDMENLNFEIIQHECST